MNTIELVITIIFGYLLFLAEEFETSAWISISSILLSALVTIPLSILIFRRSTNLAAFAIVTSIQLLLTAVFRVSLVYGGFVSYLRGVDVFGMLGLNIGTYAIFAVSGIIPAYCIKKYDPGPGFRIIPIVLSSLGVLYAYKLSSGFWSPITSFKGLLLLFAEFMAPAVYAFLGIWTVRYWRRSYHGIGRRYKSGGKYDTEMQKLQAQYRASQRRLEEQLAKAAENLNLVKEAASLAKRFDLSRKKREGSEYADVADYLLNHYPSEVAYFVAVELNERFEPRLGYPPIGQIMVAMEKEDSKGAARWIACALSNFPRVETAQLAFGIIKSAAMRSLVRAELATDDSELAVYISSGEVLAPPASPTSSVAGNPPRTKAKHQPQLSDGIERMPRRLADAERRGDRLFLHLQIVSSVILLMLCPVLGGVLGGWPGATIGLVVGWFGRFWVRRSMGLRGSNPDEGFFIRMKERANGARRGILEALIERVRQRPFTQKQCTAITKAWDETHQRIEAVTSVEEKRELIKACDAEIKRISYGQDKGER